MGCLPPSQDWMGYPPPIRTGWGYPSTHQDWIGVPTTHWGWLEVTTPLPPPLRTGRGYPAPSGLDGQSSRASTCYMASGMPLAFTQEDFLLQKGRAVHLMRNIFCKERKIMNAGMQTATAHLRILNTQSQSKHVSGKILSLKIHWF